MPRNDMPLPKRIEPQYGTMSYYAFARYIQTTLTIALIALVVASTALVFSVGMYKGYW
jgi:hypothetical protein